MTGSKFRFRSVVAVVVAMGTFAAVAEAAPQEPPPLWPESGNPEAAWPGPDGFRSTERSASKNGYFILFEGGDLTGIVHADQTTTYRISLYSEAGGPSMVDLTYSVTSGNAVILGPATVAAEDHWSSYFTVGVKPNSGLPNGTVITGTIDASIPAASDSMNVSLTVVPSREVLHRWSFVSDGTDSVGGADAVLHNGASVAFGALVLDGDDDYAELPIAATLSSLTYVSVEMWVTWKGEDRWERFFDFGTGEVVNWFMTPWASQTGARVAITTGGNAAEQRTEAPDWFPDDPTHVVFTLDGAGARDQSRLYIDGYREAVHSEVSPLTPADLGPLTNIWLGRSQYEVDPYLDASIDEFTIHGTVFTEREVYQLYRGEIFADDFEWGSTDRWSP